jgi:hypothetical protein
VKKFFMYAILAVFTFLGLAMIYFLWKHSLAAFAAFGAFGVFAIISTVVVKIAEREALEEERERLERADEERRARADVASRPF